MSTWSSIERPPAEVSDPGIGGDFLPEEPTRTPRKLSHSSHVTTSAGHTNTFDSFSSNITVTMTDSEASPAPTECKPRKSVAFADGQTVVDSDGVVTETNGVHDGDKESAASHARANGDEKSVDEMTAMFEGLAKKKKKKPKKEEGDGEGGEKAEDDGELDLSALKKKKKKKPKAPEDDFEAKLAEAGATEGEDGAAAATESADADKGLQDGDLKEGTGIWEHDNSAPINYESLLNRFFTLLHDSHPDLASSGGKSYKIPPPQCLREGNKKTIFANISEICKRMKRSDEHVTQFLFAELGTSGSVDGSRRLVIKGRFQQKQIENVLRRYIGKPRHSILPVCLHVC